MSVPREVFCLLPADKAADLRVFDNPDVDGISIRQSWEKMNPADGSYDWTYLDTEIYNRHTAAGRLAVLAWKMAHRHLLNRHPKPACLGGDLGVDHCAYGAFPALVSMCGIPHKVSRSLAPRTSHGSSEDVSLVNSKSLRQRNKLQAERGTTSNAADREHKYRHHNARTRHQPHRSRQVLLNLLHQKLERPNLFYQHLPREVDPAISTSNCRNFD